MIRIHETVTEFWVDGEQHNERNDVPVLDAVVAVTASLELNFIVMEATSKRLLLKIEGARGKVTMIEHSGAVKDMKSLLLATFIQSVFRDNLRGQEVLRNLIDDRDALQESVVDMHEAGADWKKLALGVPMGLTDVKQMTALYEKVQNMDFGRPHVVDIKV